MSVMLTNPQTNSSITNTEIAFKSDELILHGSAKTTHAVRATIQRSKASIQELASRYDLNPKTVMKWRKRAFLYDAPMGPKVPRSTVLSAEEEALAVAFRKHTLLPLDDCLYALQANRISRDRRCIDCSSATRSAGFLRSKARQRARRRSSGTRSATAYACGTQQRELPPRR